MLELSRPLLKFIRVPYDLTPGPLQAEKLDPELVARGLIVATPPPVEGEEPEEEEWVPWDERPPVFAERLKLLFDATHPEVTDVTVTPVWAAAEVLKFGGNFHHFIASRDLAKQEGIIFRHLLRMVLLADEFSQVPPPGADPAEWPGELPALADVLTSACKDDAVPVPGTSYRVGLDAALGRIPGVGDAVGGLLGSYMLLTAARLGVPRVVLARVRLNGAADSALGMVPLAGDVLDAAWRTNRENARLLEAHLPDPRGTARGRWVTVAGLAAVLVVLVAGGIAASVWLVGRLVRLIG